MSFIEIKNLKKTYQTQRGSVDALIDVNLEIKQGEILSLLGVNGAGKSTLSSIIATLHPATAGQILYQGQSIYQDIEQFRQSIGYCPQRPNLKTMISLQENLVSAGRLYGMHDTQIYARINQLAEQLGLQNFLQESASILSGGYKQRFMIARSLMHSPQLLILDEPTVGLDPDIRRHLWELILDLKQQGMTILLTTHYLDEAEKLSDRVCILDHGKIQLIGAPEQLMRDFHQNNLEDMFLQLLQNQKHA